MPVRSGGRRDSKWLRPFLSEGMFVQTGSGDNGSDYTFRLSLSEQAWIGGLLQETRRNPDTWSIGAGQSGNELGVSPRAAGLEGRSCSGSPAPHCRPALRGWKIGAGRVPCAHAQGYVSLHSFWYVGRYASRCRVGGVRIGAGRAPCAHAQGYVSLHSFWHVGRWRCGAGGIWRIPGSQC